MVRCRCLVQSGQTADAKQAVLKEALSGFAERAFGQPAEIEWITVPAGSAYTATKPSTSSIVAMTATQPLERETRAALLTDLCDVWTGQTGCSLNEIVAVISDPQPN